MFRGRAPLLPRLCVVARILRRLATQARYSKIVPIVCAAVFERDNVLNDVVVAWTQLLPALTAASMPLQEQLCRLLLR